MSQVNAAATTTTMTNSGADTAGSSSTQTASAPGAGTGAANISVTSTESKQNSSGSQGSSDWTTGFDDDLKGYVGNKGFKSPVDLATAYRNAEKLIGVPQDRVLKLPERFYDDTGKLTAEGRAIRERMGAPKEAKDYELSAPKENADPKLLDHFKSVFHELGIPKTDAEKITSSWNAYAEAQSKNAKEVAAQTMRDQQNQLSKDWGVALEQNTNIAKEAVRVMGIDAGKIDAFSSIVGHAEAMKFFHKLGTQVREAPFVGGQKPDAVMEPVNARAQIKELTTDRNFGKLLQSGDRDALARWQRLHEQAFPGEFKV